MPPKPDDEKFTRSRRKNKLSRSPIKVSTSNKLDSLNLKSCTTQSLSNVYKKRQIISVDNNILDFDGSLNELTEIKVQKKSKISNGSRYNEEQKSIIEHSTTPSIPIQLPSYKRLEKTPQKNAQSTLLNGTSLKSNNTTPNNHTKTRSNNNSITEQIYWSTGSFTENFKLDKNTSNKGEGEEKNLPNVNRLEDDNKKNFGIQSIESPDSSNYTKKFFNQKKEFLSKIPKMNPISQLERKYNTVFSLTNQSPINKRQIKASPKSPRIFSFLKSKTDSDFQKLPASVENTKTDYSKSLIDKKKTKSLVFPTNNNAGSSSRAFLFNKKLTKEKSLTSLFELRVKRSLTTEHNQTNSNDYTCLADSSSTSNTSSIISVVPNARIDNGSNSLKDLLSELRSTSFGNINVNKENNTDGEDLDDCEDFGNTTSLILDQGVVFDEVEVDTFSDKFFDESRVKNFKKVTNNEKTIPPSISNFEINESFILNTGEKTLKKNKLTTQVESICKSTHISKQIVNEKETKNLNHNSETNINDDAFGSDDFDYEELDRKLENKASGIKCFSSKHENIKSFQRSDPDLLAIDSTNTLKPALINDTMEELHKNTSSMRNDSNFDEFTDNDDIFSDFDDEELLNKLSQKRKILESSEVSSDINVVEPNNSHNVVDAQNNRAIHSCQQIFEDKKKQSGEGENDTDEEETSSIISFSRPWLHRFQIKEVHLKKYSFKGIKKDQIILKVTDSSSKIKNIVVRDAWLATKYDVGEVIHVVGENPTVIDNKKNLIILNPDTLISATTLGDSLDCERRSSLKARYIFPGESSKALIVGNIVHEVFQKCMISKRSDSLFINETLEEAADHYIIDIFSILEEKQNIIDSCQEHMKYVKEWVSKYMLSASSNSLNTTGSSSPLISTFGWKEKTNFSVSKILDIEENIWSPIFGLRGLIDATIEASIKGEKHYSLKESSGKFIAPMEIKSGKDYISHKAQTSLYTLLMKDRYDTDINFFILVYTKLYKTTKYQIDQRDLRMLLVKRNTLSKYLRSIKTSIPPLIKNSICDRCFVKDVCMSYTKLIEAGTEETSGFKPGEFLEITAHMKPEYGKYYKFWEELLNKEENFLSKLTKEIWIHTSQEREANSGKCIGDLIILSVNYNATTGYYVYTFMKDRNSPKSSSSLLGNTTITLKDMVLISDEDGHFSLSSGFVIFMSEKIINVSTKRRIDFSTFKLDGFDNKTNQTFKGVLDSSSEDSRLSAELENFSLSDSNSANQELLSQIPKQANPVSRSLKYRLDKYPAATGLKLARYNLLDIFMDPKKEMIRNILVNKMREPAKEIHNNEFGDVHIDSTKFNQDQIRAMQKCFSTDDFALILGMPGTGKTTTITELIKHLICKGKSVLVASYTHSAVDNILVKLKKERVTDIIRLGALNKIHADVREFSPYLNDEIFQNKQLFLKKFLQTKIVATTCLGINDWVFNHRRFDYCIIDEASQVSMPICLGPIRFSDRFILVGDHYQLPPLIMAPKARKGLSRSLFKILSENFPESVIDLTYQYRMCDDIMFLTNTLIYNGRLKSGSEAVSNKKLNIPEPLNLSAHYSKILQKSADKTLNWMKLIYNEDNKVIFLNHDPMDATERIIGDKVENLVEAELINVIVESLLVAGVDQSAIGVMSLYRAQIKLISDRLKYRKNLEILTTDRFQGLDKECIIISLVRSNDKQKVGELLKEWRRINVAITRAKSKLIILGSKKTLKNLPIIDAFMRIIENKGWLYNLPINSLECYEFFNQFHDNNTLNSTNLISNSAKKTKTKTKYNSTKLSEKLIDNHLLLKNIIVDDDI